MTDPIRKRQERSLRARSRHRICSGPLSVASFFNSCADVDEVYVPENLTSYKSRSPTRKSISKSDDLKNLIELSKREPYVFNPSHTQLNDHGKFEETWDLDPDAYALGICSLVQRGWARAWPDVGVAFLSPVLQNISFFALFNYLLKLEEVNLRWNLLPIIGICLFLMGVNLVEEITETVKKMAFCCRCLLGKYELPHDQNYMVIGVALAFFQNFVAVGTFALTADLLLRSKTVLDVFLNFLGISFITEVDNTLMRVSGVQYRAQDVDFVFTVERKKQSNNVPTKDDAPRSPITMRMLVLVNAMTLCTCLMSMWIGIFGGRDVGRQLWEESWLLWWSVFFLAMVLCNFLMWIGSRMIGPWRTLKWLQFTFQVLFWTNILHRYYSDGGWILLWNPLLNMVTFVVPQVWMSVGIACEDDGLCHLESGPLIGFNILLATPFWIHQLMLYGVS